jgi:peptide/nickel transport system substrate-binding protein
MWHLSDVLSDLEKKFIIASLVIASVSVLGLLYHFYKDSGLVIALEKNTYSESYLGDLSILNPVFVLPDSPEDDIVSFIFSSLVKRDVSNSNFVPDLAAMFTVLEDGTSFQFELREDVKWHDGTALTIDDVLFTFDIFKDETFYSKYFEVFQKVTVSTEGNTITFKIPSTDILFIENFTFPILPKHLLQGFTLEQFLNSSFSYSPVGSGPYLYKSLESVKSYKAITLERNENYYAEIPTFNKLLFYFFTDEQDYLKYRTRFSGVISSKPDQQLLQAGYKEHQMLSSEYQFLFFNTESEYLKNPIVRQALYAGLNFSSIETEDYLMIDKLHLYNEDNQIAEEIDPKKLLYSVGWQKYTSEFSDDFRRNIQKEKLSLKLVTIDDPYYLELSKKMESQLLELGVELKYSGFTEKELSYDFLASGNYDLLLVGIKNPNIVDLFPYLHSTQISYDGGLNFSKYVNLEMDLLLEDLRMSLNEDRISKVRDEIILRLSRDVPLIYVSRGKFYYYLKSDIDNIKIPDSILDLRDRFLFISHWSYKQ